MAQAQVSFTSLSGNAVNLDFLLKTTRGIATDLQTLLRLALKDAPAFLDGLECIADDIVSITPDKSAPVPDLDPIELAQTFLAEERRQAQKFLLEEAERQRNTIHLLVPCLHR